MPRPGSAGTGRTPRLRPAVLGQLAAHAGAAAVLGSSAPALNAGFWTSLPLDYLLRITVRSHLQRSEARKMPAPDPKHPPRACLAPPHPPPELPHHSLRPLWAELFNPQWSGYEDWANPNWPVLSPLAANLKPTWEYTTPLRTELERRAALVELDALVAVWLGITADQLAGIFKSRYPQLCDYESATCFDANGRKIAADFNAYGHGQTKQDYLRLLDHMVNPATTPPPRVTPRPSTRPRCGPRTRTSRRGSTRRSPPAAGPRRSRPRSRPDANAVWRFPSTSGTATHQDNHVPTQRRSTPRTRRRRPTPAPGR